MMMETLGWIIAAFLGGFMAGGVLLTIAHRSEREVLRAQIRELGGAPK